jgi:hypothetical protein
LPSVGSSDAHSRDRTTFLQIRETVTASCFDRIDAVLYAYMNNERVAALDFMRPPLPVFENSNDFGAHDKAENDQQMHGHQHKRFSPNYRLAASVDTANCGGQVGHCPD